jgi:MoaA/NifB/PqqE/SkfB family radical SAM enzyme
MNPRTTLTEPVRNAEMLEQIGFYTLSDERCQNLSPTSPMQRCEMILTDKCNFSCPYCRGLRDDCKGDMPIATAVKTLVTWLVDGLKNIRFSGGEPLTYPSLNSLVSIASHEACERVAISTNGSFPLKRYMELVSLGVDDFSISLDACCASGCEKMSGGSSRWDTITENIRELAKRVYVTVGVVLTDENLGNLSSIVTLAHELGVADIRIIPAAQEGTMIRGVEKLDPAIIAAHPILAYRVANILLGKPVRSIQEYDSHRCYLPIDDSVVAGDYHFPCVIYMREQGEPIGQVGPNMRAVRIAWSEQHNSFDDPICQKNCLDVCVDHNNKCASCKERTCPT